MLRIDLKPGESVKVGDDITVHLEEKSGQRARLAFDAPRTVRIIKNPMVSEVIHAARRGIMRAA